MTNTISITHKLYSFRIGNSIIVDGNYISHMNASEKDDKNRFCISTQQESKTLAIKTPKQGERQSDTRTLDTRQDNDKVHVHAISHAGRSTRKDSRAARAQHRQSEA